jgi:hypothetical protein
MRAKIFQCFSVFVLVITSLSAMPQSASAAGLCAVRVLNTNGCWGYFINQNYQGGNGINGDNIIFDPGNLNGWGIPANIGSNADPTSFINWIGGMLGSGTGYSYDKAGAAFIVDTWMKIGGGGSQGSTAQGIADAQAAFPSWAQQVIRYNNKGLINWNWHTTLTPGVPNSLHACTVSTTSNNCDGTNYHPMWSNGGIDAKDFAFYNNNDFEDSHYIVVHDPNNGSQTDYTLRRECGNLIGNVVPPPNIPPNFTLNTSITATSNGNPLSSGSYVQAGDQVSFSYDVNNSGTDTATGVACQAHANSTGGWIAVPGSPSTTGPTPPGVACTGTFPPGNTHLGTESIASAPNDTSLCRSLIVNPATGTGGQSGVEACVYVSSRPYFRVYGGDVSAGNAQSNACGTVTKAGIVGWSKDLSSYAGAATQYAALALDNIYDFSTSLGNAAGAAAPPSGLAFANTTAAGNVFGGSFGSQPCMTDYYASRSGNPFVGGNITPLGTGSYTATGPITIHGNVNPNNRIVIYVNGNVTIDGNVTYPGSWNTSTLPLFEVIASGSIYIDHTVTNVDGLYVAQTNGTVGSGTIYTCTNGATPYTVNATGSFNTPCSSTLTINGSFVANQVQLLRTKGTVKQSAAGEASGSGNQAEVFNYSPTLWMAQPSNAPQTANYDSITSLPPIL